MTEYHEQISEDGKTSWRVVAGNDELFRLQKYELRYDEEEAVDYWVRCRPDPSGIFMNLELAAKEAEALSQ